MQCSKRHVTNQVVSQSAALSVTKRGPACHKARPCLSQSTALPVTKVGPACHKARPCLSQSTALPVTKHGSACHKARCCHNNVGSISNAMVTHPSQHHLFPVTDRQRVSGQYSTRRPLNCYWWHYRAVELLVVGVLRPGNI